MDVASHAITGVILQPVNIKQAYNLGKTTPKRNGVTEHMGFFFRNWL